MKKIEEKFFWVTNFVAPWIIASYFANEGDNWINIIVPIYCILYWFCAITYLSYINKEK